MATMIHFSNITKQFPGNKALDSVDFTVDKGRYTPFLGKTARVNPPFSISFTASILITMEAWRLTGKR